MHVIISSPIPEVASYISVACSLTDIDCECEPSIQEFGSKLFRDPDAIGVYWSPGPTSAAQHCHRMRLAEVRNVLFALYETSEPEKIAVKGRVLALAAGVDEVQPWPIDGQELVARLHALKRRRRVVDESTVKLPGCVFRTDMSDLIGMDVRVHLTKHECALLVALTSRPGMLVTKGMCMLTMYDGRDEPGKRIIDVFVCKLRKKIMIATGGVDCIETVWGQGFRFDPEGFRPGVNVVGRGVAI